MGSLQRGLKAGHGEDISDSILMGILLKGVSSKFAQSIEALRCMDKLALKGDKDKLIAADDRIRSKEDTTNDGAAYSTQSEEKQREKQKKQWHREKGRCYNCGKVGHLAKDCRQRQDSPDCVRPGDSKPGDRSNGTALTTSAALSTKVSGVHSEKLLVDTGATHNMCYQPSRFVNIKPSNVPFVRCGGGEAHEVVGQGTVCVLSTSGVVRLQNVLCVPTLKVNLFSWAMAFRKGAQLSSKGGTLAVVLRGRTLLKASIIDDLFQVEGHVLGVDEVPHNIREACGQWHTDASADVWHRCLGHPASNMNRRYVNVEL